MAGNRSCDENSFALNFHSTLVQGGYVGDLFHPSSQTPLFFVLVYGRNLHTKCRGGVPVRAATLCARLCSHRHVRNLYVWCILRNIMLTFLFSTRYALFNSYHVSTNDIIFSWRPNPIHFLNTDFNKKAISILVFLLRFNKNVNTT